MHTTVLLIIFEQEFTRPRPTMCVTKMATQRECLRWAVNSSKWKPTASVSRCNHFQRLQF